MFDLSSDANPCFVCGPRNPLGLRLCFRMEDGCCRSQFTPGPHHCGYQRMIHGGIVFSALDDVMANWLYLGGERAHTARCTIRYREPAMLGDTLLLEGRLVKRKSRLVLMSGLAMRASDGAVLAETEGTFMVTPPG